jgi:hypothetical protein
MNSCFFAGSPARVAMAVAADLLQAGAAGPSRLAAPVTRTRRV